MLLVYEKIEYIEHDKLFPSFVQTVTTPLKTGLRYLEIELHILRVGDKLWNTFR